MVQEKAVSMQRPRISHVSLILITMNGNTCDSLRDMSSGCSRQDLSFKKVSFIVDVVKLLCHSEGLQEISSA